MLHCPVFHKRLIAARRARPTKPGGFTFVELIVTIAIIGILAGIAIPAYSNHRKKMLNDRAIFEIQQLEVGITTYYVEHQNQYPDTLADLGPNQNVDPWGNPYQYLKIEGGGSNVNGSCRKDGAAHPLNTDYDLYSMGADGQTKPPLNNPVSRDDIVRANNGGFVDLASEF